MNFKDHFSGHAAAYREARPLYPNALFEYLAALCVRHDLAWDAGCGNGQAALALAERFDQVIATDPSAPQIAEAPPHPRVHYRVEPAEAGTLAAASADLITVAQALHWFDQTRFHSEVRRVAKPGAAIAVWSYALCHVSPGVDAVLAELYEGIVGPYWPPERTHVANGYADLPFPYAPLAAPSFAMRHDWTLAQLFAYLGTWSAVQRYRSSVGIDPREAIRLALEKAWGDPDATQDIVWPLIVKAGRVD